MTLLADVGIKGDLKVTLEGEGKDSLARVIKDAVNDDPSGLLMVEVHTYKHKTKLRILHKQNFTNLTCKSCDMRLTSFADDYTMALCSKCLKETRSKEND